MATAETPALEIPEDMKESAKKSARRVNEERARGDVDLSDLSARRTKQVGRSKDFVVSEIPSPLQDPSEYGPMGFAAVPVGEITGEVETQEFTIDPEKFKNLVFTKPAQNLPKKRLYTVKAIHRDGRLVQLPFEAQIQNNAGGDPEDMIGLRRYERKGIILLFDFTTGTPIYCPAWGCWAQANPKVMGHFCSEKHAQHTLPNMYKDAGQILTGLGIDATTTQTWKM